MRVALTCAIFRSHPKTPHRAIAVTPPRRCVSGDRASSRWWHAFGESDTRLAIVYDPVLAIAGMATSGASSGQTVRLKRIMQTKLEHSQISR
jgi:hypothetical protein